MVEGAIAHKTMWIETETHFTTLRQVEKSPPNLYDYSAWVVNFGTCSVSHWVLFSKQDYKW